MTRAWVVAHEPAATHLAAGILAVGGSLADAAVAGALAQGAAEPLWTSLGGFGVGLVRDASSGLTKSIGFHALAPLAATETMYELGDDGAESATPGTYEVKGRVNQLGYLSVATPGLPAGLAAVRDGRSALPLPAVLGPVADLLEAGATVSNHVYGTWATDIRPGYEPPYRRLTATPAAAALYGGTGALPAPGSRLRNPGYARTIRHLGRAGLEDFYTGETAGRITADFAANGGLIGRLDLESYRVDESPPAVSRYGPLEVQTPPAPSVAGQVHLALQALEHEDLKALDPLGPAYVGLVARALNALPASRQAAAVPGSLGGDTTHIICVDDAGNAVTLTHSLGAASGVVTPGLGFMYNGAMHRFDPRPGRPASIRPGIPRPTGMAPTVVLRDGRTEIVAGGAGGLGIVQGITQCLIGVIAHGLHPQLAVSAPRFAAFGDTIQLEAGFPRSTAADLRRGGMRVTELPDALDRNEVGRIVMVSRLNAGEWQPGTDPRGGGIAVSA